MYATSKFAVRGFTESLRCDMLAGDLPVAVSCVHPGGVRTEIATNALRDAEALGVPVSDEDRERSSAFAKRLLKMDPARAAKIIVDGVEAGKPRIRVGRDARFVDRLVRLMPVHYQKLGVDMFRRSEQKSQLRTQE
jgi:short-subunit dehydrogenase